MLSLLIRDPDKNDEFPQFLQFKCELSKIEDTNEQLILPERKKCFTHFHTKSLLNYANKLM